MEFLPIIFALFGICLLILVADRIRTSRQRRSMVEAGFPASWVRVLQENVPIYRRLSQPLQRELQRHVLQFIEEKDFEPCGDFDNVTDEMKVTISAYAALLLLNKDRPYYARLRTILVYPDDYWADGDDEFDDEVRSGESWETGSVILSWEAVKNTGKHQEAGLNVAIHEFAHQVDQHASGTADGTPPLESSGAYRAWSKAFTAAYADLKERTEQGRQPGLDDYGVESPGEFFAVATEAFFETPHTLNATYPEVYAQLRSLYKVDPILWERSETDRPGTTPPVPGTKGRQGGGASAPASA